jgi:DNA-binding MurR/RpiR family transcriptional regulator
VSETTITDQAPIDAVAIRERIRAGLTTFSPAERRVAVAVLKDPVAVIHLSVTELAAIAESSPASVVRMCVTLGLRGFQDLKIRLASEAIPAAQSLVGEIGPDDDLAVMTSKVIDGTSRALADAARTIDIDAVGAIVDSVLGARRVMFGAVGTSAPLALDAAYRLTTLGVEASFAQDVHTQHVTARMLRPGDVFFAISHTGSTFETLSTARAARAAGATTIALTSFARSPLTEVSDLVLVAGSAETAYRVEAMASRVVHLTVLDAIFVAISHRSADSTAHLALTADVLIEHRM